MTCQKKSTNAKKGLISLAELIFYNAAEKDWIIPLPKRRIKIILQEPADRLCDLSNIVVLRVADIRTDDMFYSEIKVLIIYELR